MKSPFALAALAALLLAGCTTMPPSTAEKDPTLNKDKQAVNENREALQNITEQLTKLKTEIIDDNKVTIDALKQQKDAASGGVLAAKAANSQNPTQNKFTAAVTAELGVAEAALGGPSATTLAEANKQLQLLLSDAQAERDHP